MIDLDAPDPFSLASWRANRLTDDRAKCLWTICSVLSIVHGRPFLEIFAHLAEEAVAKA